MRDFNAYITKNISASKLSLVIILTTVKVKSSFLNLLSVKIFTRGEMKTHLHIY